jgi:hypothetical protein
MAFFRYEGHKLAYTVHGRGARTTVLMPGLLLSQKMQEPLAADLAGLQGILFGRTAPEREARRAFDAPGLVIGHPRDPLHPFSDADTLAAELPNGRLIDANSIVELRVNPERLTRKIAAFVDECWACSSRTQPSLTPTR